MLVNGTWTTNWKPSDGKDPSGAFIRPTSSFRSFVTPDGEPGPTGDGGFAAAAGRYHLYVGLICPWASRTLAARALKGLEAVISVTIVDPAMTDEGWRFTDAPDTGPDPLYGAHYLHQIYTRADPHFTGRATIPVLWDKQRQTIVNNESADILRILNSGFGSLAKTDIDLYPDALREEIDALNARIYPRLNNGVYRAGFAATQAAYEAAFKDVFAELDALEAHLSTRTFLVGERLTEADIRLFVTLVRFDAAYHGLFKCNRRRLADYAKLSAYVKRVIALPGIRPTVNIDHIKRGYYSLKALNPSGIVPAGPDLDWA
ncbi:MAG: glutathione S-transferase C-terminal domain-containing protein [Ancalomicrobiaceae bacterium]|nr:glutathione S-transferase C-terminal domain-containing protein [Ancalomicrobiaceae bacterium]